MQDRCAVETRLDSEHSSELVKLRADMTERLLSDLVANKEGLAADLQHEGPSVPAQKLQLSYTHTRTHARTHTHTHTHTPV